MGMGATVAKPPPPQGEPPAPPPGTIDEAEERDLRRLTEAEVARHAVRPAGAPPVTASPVAYEVRVGNDQWHQVPPQWTVTEETDGYLRVSGPFVSSSRFAYWRRVTPAPVTVPPPGEVPGPATVTCEGCGNEIDPDTCGCGESHKDSYGDGGHPHIPMGCDCYRAERRPVTVPGAREVAQKAYNFIVGLDEDRIVPNLARFIEAHTRGLTGELAAYKRAKTENDERFMTERDDARAEVERLTRENEELRVTSEHWLGKAHSVGAEVSRLTLENEALRKGLGNAADDVQFVADWFYRNDRPYTADVLYESAKRIRALATPPDSPGEGSPGEGGDRGE